MDFTSHIASQATPAYAIQMLNGDMTAVAVLISYCTAGGGVVEFLLNPWMGRLSDRYGRMLPLLTMPMLTAVARGTPPALGCTMATLIFGRATSGGSKAAYFTAVKASIADCVPSERRTAVLGKLGAWQQASFMVGMFSAGAVTQYYGPRLAYIISSASATLATLVMWFGMSETLTQPVPFKAPNPFSFVELLQSNSIYNKTTAGAAGKLALVLGLQKGTGEPGLTDAKNLINRSAIGWDDAQRGNFLALEGLAMMVANALTGKMVNKLGTRLNLMLGGSCKIVQYLLSSLYNDRDRGS